MITFSSVSGCFGHIAGVLDCSPPVDWLLRDIAYRDVHTTSSTVELLTQPRTQALSPLPPLLLWRGTREAKEIEPAIEVALNLRAGLFESRLALIEDLSQQRS